MRRLVESAGLQPGDMVLEVGGGTGALTELIAGQVANLICIEIDRDLHSILMDRLGAIPGVTLVLGDILESKHRLLPAVGQRLPEWESTTRGSCKLVANLPYQIAASLLMNLLIDYPAVRRLCFTVQAEVGERITAPPGCKDFGPLSIVIQALCDVEILARLGPQAFWPQPEVDSVMIRMDVVRSPFADRSDVRRFADLVRGTFDHRRKTLRSALGYVLEVEALERVCQRLDATRRPESFAVQEWIEVFHFATGVDPPPRGTR